MSETKFTPRFWEALPWEVEAGGKDWNVWGPKSSNHIGDENLRGDFGSESDARLISAAPDMYEALLKGKEYTTLQRSDGEFDVKTIRAKKEFIKARDAALAKARGEA